MYSGITPSWAGTIIEPITTRNSELRPGNRRRAKANPARLASTTFDPATVHATISEFWIARQKSTVSNTAPRLSSRCPPGTSAGVRSPSTELSLVDMTNDQYSGTPTRP